MSIADEQRVSASGATTTQSASQPGAYSPQVIRKLNALTSDFYAREAASFSATRQAPWHGWEKAWELITAHDAVQGPFPSHAARVPDDSAGDSGAPLTILDLGCGNLRFERFLAEHTNAPLRITALDNCPDLASPAIGALSAAFPHSPSSSSAASKTKGGDASGQGTNLPEKTTVDLRALDIVESLLDGTFADRLPRNSHDLAVAFGLMHHLPTFALRARVLEGLLGSLRPGGFAVVSFWQFLNDPRLAAKAATVTAEGRATHHLAAFQENDFLLGWQHTEGIYRFCHHTPEAEIDSLLTAIRESNASVAGGRAPAAPLSFRELARFSADGKQSNLNRYVVLQRSQC